jgi:hypothetical protein
MRMHSADGMPSSMADSRMVPIRMSTLRNRLEVFQDFYRRDRQHTGALAFASTAMMDAGRYYTT